LNLTRLSSFAIKRCEAVQKQLCSAPKGIQDEDGWS